MIISIVGAGKLGRKVATALLGGNYEITMIDKNEEKLQKVANQMDLMTINADAREITVLKNMGIDKFQYLLAATDNDEANIIIASFA